MRTGERVGMRSRGMGREYLGELTHDGPATVEQISLYLPVTGTLAQGTEASLRYKATGGSWIDAHPLFRIRPEFSTSSNTPQTLPTDAFAGVIWGLQPDTEYQAEATVLGEIRNITTTTRALPSPSGATTISINTGMNQSQIESAINGASPGAVIEFADGTYNVDDLTISVSGTESQPIYMRGESKGGVIIKDTSGSVVSLENTVNDFIIENLTIEGSRVDSQGTPTSTGIRFKNTGRTTVQDRITVRQIVMVGVDRAFYAYYPIQQALIYDNTITGNNPWTQAALESNQTWDDDGIQVTGKANCVFNNTLYGFGDCLTMQIGEDNIGNHFFRNDIKQTGDDAFEADGALRNITFYDNRIWNSMTFVSCDPCFNGPLFAFRNISINTGRSPYKLNDANTGHFFYNNTVVRTNGYSSGAGWGWQQSSNGPQRAWGMRNNILTYRGSGRLIAPESASMDPIDFTNNAWYPDEDAWWSNSGGSFTTIANAYAGLPATTPVFSGEPQRHENDFICESDPFTTNIVLGSDYLTEVTTAYTPSLDSGSVCKNTGVAINGVTDGYSGGAPDVGALIEGRNNPVWGDRSTTNLSTAAAGLSSGQYTSSGFNGPSAAQFFQNTPNDSLINYAARFFYDSVRRVFRFFGMGEGNSGNDLRQMVYDEVADNWYQEGSDGDGGGTNWYGHGYDDSALDPATGDCYWRRHGQKYLMKWDYGTSTWSGPTASFSPSTEVSMGIAVHPNLFGPGDGGVVHIATYSIQAFRFSTQSWTQIHGAGTNGAYNSFACWVPSLGAVYCGGGNSRTTYYKVVDYQTVSTLTNLPINCGGDNVKGTMIEDPRAAGLLIIDNNSANWYESANGTTWAQGSGSHPFEATAGGGPEHIVCTMPQYGVVWGLSFTGYNQTPQSRIWKP